MITVVAQIAIAICLLMSAATALALVETNEWWIRVFDFPRLQIAAVLLATLPIYWLARQRAGTVAVLVVSVSIAALAWQIWKILPYTPVWNQQMISTAACPDHRRVRFLLANVLQENRSSQRLLQIAQENDPDIILLTEIDEWWAREMAMLQETHPQFILEPRSNTYGIGLYSRLFLEGGKVRYLLDDGVPSILTRVVLPDGIGFSFWGVHPAPPRPGNDTHERDAELLIIAKEVERNTGPAIVAGDLNDVAWSSTTTLFQEISGMLDPRIGRGIYATFNADWFLLRWPLDHIFASKEWTMGEFRRLGDIGSDHFPILVELCHQPQAADVQEGNEREPDDLKRANEHIDEGRDAAGE